ncbi:MAG: ATP-binding cassette domain-containing protein [Pseudomonadota bacterium]|nr:ATP-binding cassette domain-containing protein [Pseudomonadota bacterium]
MEAVLEARGVVKRFGRIEALRGTNFEVRPGEVVALLGDNGAGKSTLVKTLCGVHTPDEGEVLVDGKPVTFNSPSDAQAMGIEVVYQDLALAPDLDSAANVFLNRELLRGGLAGKLGVLNFGEMRRRTEKALEDMQVKLPSVSVRMDALSGGQRQSVAVVRAIMWADRLVVMDEPTAALGVEQQKAVLRLIKRVRETGRSVILISHNVPDVLEVADRAEVLRHGRRTARFEGDQMTTENLVGAITGALIQEDA